MEAAAAPQDGRRVDELQTAGLAGTQPTAVWCSNIPKHHAEEATIRRLMSAFGDIRRVLIRRKDPPKPSWCMVTFHSSESVTAALKAPVYLSGLDGSQVQLVVELPKVGEALAKASPGELGGVLVKLLDAEMEDSNPEKKAATDRRVVEHRLAAAAAIEKAEAGRLETEAAGGAAEGVAKPTTRRKMLGKTSGSSKNLGDDVDAAPVRNVWNTVRSSAFKNKLAVAAMFTQNDDENEKEVISA